MHITVKNNGHEKHEKLLTRAINERIALDDKDKLSIVLNDRWPVLND